MHKWLDRLVSTLWAAIIMLVVVVALYVAGGRQLFNYLPEYKPEIEAILSQRLNIPVSIYQLEGEWQSLTPKLTISGLALRPEGNLSADFPFFQQASVTVDVLGSMRHMKPILKDFRVYGLNLTVVKDAEGKFSLQGIQLGQSDPQPSPTAKSSNKKDNTKALLDLLLRQPQIRFSNVHIKYVEAELERVLIAKDIQFTRIGDKNYLDVNVQLSKDSGAQLIVKAAGQIDPYNFEEALADVYVSIDGEDLSRWIPETLLKGLKLNHVTPLVEVWGKLEEGRIQNVQGQAYLKDVHAEGVQGPLPLIRQLGGRFFWKSIAHDQWQLAINQLRWEQEDTDLNNERIYFSFIKSEDGFSTIDAQLSKLNVQPLINLLLATNLLQNNLRETITTLNPQGQLSDIAATVVTDSEQKKHVDFSVAFENVDISPWKKAPGFSGLSGRVIGTPEKGIAEVWSDGAVFDWPEGMPQPVAGSLLQGVVDWDKHATGITVRTGRVVAHAEAANGAVMATVDIPLKPAANVDEASVPEITAVGENTEPPTDGATPELPKQSSKLVPDLQLIATVVDGDVAEVENYLPNKVPRPLANWLEQALQGGQLLEGSFLFRGSLKVPKTARQFRTFQMHFIGEEAEVAYLPGWPSIREGIADIYINEGHTEAEIFRGKIYDAEIITGRIEVPFPRKTPVPVLYVDGQLKGTAEDGLKILQETPIQKALGSFVYDMAAKGKMEVGLDLAIPLAKSDLKLKTDVAIDLQDGQYQMPKLNLTLDDVSGSFKYSTTEGLSGEKLLASWHGFPLEGEIRSLFQGPNWIDTVISAKGNTSIEQLKDWSGQWVFDFLDGEASYEADLHFFTKNAGPQEYNYIEVRTDLNNVAVDLPFPYSKAKGLAAPSIFRMSLDNSSDPLKIDLLYNELLSASMMIDSRGVERAHFNAGGNEWLPPIAEPGIHASGYIDRLDFDEWTQFFSQLGAAAANSNDDNKASTEESEPRSEPSRTVYESIGLIDLYTSSLTAFSLELTNLNLQTMFVDEEWYVNLQNENLSALLRVPKIYSENTPDFSSHNPWRSFLDDPMHLDVHFMRVPEDPNYFFADKGLEETLSSVEEANQDSLLMLPSENAVGTPMAQEGQEQDAQLYQPVEQVLATTVASDVDTQSSEEELFKPNWIPPVSVRLKNLWLQDEDWGDWSVQATPVATGLRLSDVKANFRSLELTGQGHWTVDKNALAAQNVYALNGESGTRNDANQSALEELPTATWFTGKATTKDIALVMKHFGYEPTVQSEIGSTKMDLNWPGSPFEFDLTSISGDMSMELDKGYLLSVDPATSSVRVLGLLNFETLQRRLQFDFSDIYKKGLAYDNISGTFNINNSVLHTPMVQIRGPSTKMDIQGDLNVDTGHVDQELTLTLPLAKNLVIPAGAVGGLPAAATAYVIEKALGDQIDKLTTLHFKIQGDLEDPQVTEVKFFK